MILENIEDCIKDRVTEAVKEVQLRNKKGDLSPINIFTGILPPKNYFKDIDEYPFVMIRTHLSEDDIENQSSFQDFVLYFGICAEAENKVQNPNSFDIENYQNGHKDLSGLYEKVRTDFLQKSMLSNDFGFVGTVKKLKFEAFLEQPYPYFVGQLNLRIESELTEEVVDFGD